VDSTKSLTHDGGGDTTSLANIVKWALRKYSADPSRVFLTGISSGCLMSNVMAATYPDLFAAASCYAGAPAGCLAGSGGSSANSTDGVCLNGLNIKTPTEWAGVAHAMYPGYTGPYPRFQTWHGDADELVSYRNFGEELKQWSALHGVSNTQNITDTPVVGTTRIEFGDGTKVVGYSVKGGSHVLPMQEVVDLEWFGL
jgi:acetylxylan esterase